MKYNKQKIPWKTVFFCFPISYNVNIGPFLKSLFLKSQNIMSKHISLYLGDFWRAQSTRSNTYHKAQLFTLVNFILIRERKDKKQNSPHRVPSDLNREEPCLWAVHGSHYSQDIIWLSDTSIFFSSIHKISINYFCVKNRENSAIYKFFSIC